MLSAPPLQQTSDCFKDRNHHISFDNVSFAYNNNVVLHNINLEIKEGSLTALIGESGSGKSTLAKLLVHFYDVHSGSIKIGNQDLRQMSIETLNNQIAYVSQEQFLFNTTLMENIMGRLDASDEEVYPAASKAQCDEFLSRLELGIDLLAGDGGKQLSGGNDKEFLLLGQL